MSTPDYPDWATPVAVIEQLSTDQLPGNILVPNGASAIIDTSRYQSLALAMTLPNPGGVQRYLVQLLWTFGAQPLARDTLSFHAASVSGVYPGEIDWQTPVRGPVCNVSALGSDNTSIVGSILASTRALAGRELSYSSVNLGGLLLDTGNVNILAGATSPTVYIPPVARALRLVSSYPITDCVLNLNGVGDFGAGLSAVRTWRAQQAVSPQTWDDVLMPGVACELAVTNNGGVAHAGSVQVWDVS